MMTITAMQQTEIIKLSQAMFNAAPGAVYLGNFADYMTANNATMTDLANFLANSSEFIQSSSYPTSLTNTEFSARFVTNMVGGTVSNTTHSMAVSTIANMLDAGQTRGEVMLWAADALAGATGDPEWADAAAQFNNRVAVAQYYSVDRAGSATDLTTLRAMTANVTNTAASMAAGMAMIDTVMAGMGMTNPAVAGMRMANTGATGNFILPGSLALTGASTILAPRSDFASVGDAFLAENISETNGAVPPAELAGNNQSIIEIVGANGSTTDLLN